MKDTRPRNIDFRTLKLPLPAITSILHRISGAFLFFGIALLLYLLDKSLASEAGFLQVTDLLTMLWVKLVVWAVVAGLLYHLVAGIRHLLMDSGIGESLTGGQLAAKLTIAVSAALILAAGVWLW
ncbi:MAG: succinate dehydrogenase, cytochrome b556 subunit [Pseudohongiellaceae bacterium]